MYAAIRRGKAKPGTAEELTRRVNEEALPILSKMPGFKAYYLVLAEDNAITVFNVFEDQATAEASNAQMLPWIRANFAPLLDGPPEGTAGKVLVHKTE